MFISLNKRMSRSILFAVKILVCTSLVSTFKELSFGLQTVNAEYRNGQVPGMQLRLE